MKTKLFILIALFVLIMNVSLFAQINPPTEPIIIVEDTLYVFPTYNDTTFDAINKWIDYGFSLDPQIEVFKLARNETYKVSHTIRTDLTLCIVAEKPDAEHAPPLIVGATDLDNEFPDNFIVNNGSVTVKNLYFCGADIEAQVVGECASVRGCVATQADNADILIDGCYFEWIRTSYESSVNNASVTFTNNVCMNNKDESAGKWSMWWGFPVLMNGRPTGQVIMKNNTFLNIPGPIFFNWKALTDYVEFDHNTIINNCIYTFFNTSWTDAVVSNNIFLNAMCEGIERQRLNADTSLANGIINIDLLERYALDSLYAANEEIDRSEAESNRKLSLLNNYCGWTQEIIDYWAACPETLRVETWMNTRVRGLFDDDESYPYFIEENLYSMEEEGDPQFIGEWTSVQTMDLFVNYMTYVLRRGQDEPTRYYYCPGEPGPQPNPAMVWPLQLDLRIANSALVGTDSKPIGDLNWYPEYAERWDPDVLSTRVETGNDLPVEFKLSQNFPNPFNPTTTIKYSIGKVGEVKMTIFDILGKKVKTLVNETQAPGTYQVIWDGTNALDQKVGSGIYFYKLETKNRSQINKMLLIK